MWIFTEYTVFPAMKAGFDVSGGGMGVVLGPPRKKGRWLMASAANYNKGEDNHSVKLSATSFTRNQ
jgi:hypothetical protein